MKKRLLCLCVGIMCLSLCTACSSNGTALIPDTTESTADVYAIAALETGETLVLEESNTDEVLMGQWVLGDEIVTESYYFYEDGTGFYQLEDQVGSSSRDFTYTVDENGYVDMLFDGAGYVERYAYTVEGETLTLEDNFGAVLELNKVN